MTVNSCFYSKQWSFEISVIKKKTYWRQIHNKTNSDGLSIPLKWVDQNQLQIWNFMTVSVKMHFFFSSQPTSERLSLYHYLSWYQEKENKR